MNGLDLFTGAGLFSLALRNHIPGFRTAAYVEIDPYCQAILVARITDGLLDDAPVWDDIRTFDGRPFAGMVDIITAGFPCQPYSVAGKQAGEHDERNLWPDTVRIIGEVRPRFILLENVPGLLGFGYIRRIFGDLAESGYDAEWDVVGASDVGASHRRKRLWILAESGGNRRRGRSDGITGGLLRPLQTSGSGDVAHTNGAGREECGRGITDRPEYPAVECGGEDVADAERAEPRAGIAGEQGQAAELRRDRFADGDAAMGDTSGGRLRGSDESQPCELTERYLQLPTFPPRPGETDVWERVLEIDPRLEPALCRMADGMAFRTERLKMLGNGIVPMVVGRILEVNGEGE